MGETSENKPIKHRKHLSAGLLAHVDAGKTTLSEGMLYISGNIRKLGRVDKKDAFLDTFELERERGITIFSKQAILTTDDMELTLLDTPGHVDFSAEMERTLQVLDMAILVISGADGVQGHTETLWRLLARYHVPTFIFINKMDQEGTDPDAILSELKKRLDENCVDFRFAPAEDSEMNRLESETFWENAAMCDEQLLDAYLEKGMLEKTQISACIMQRKMFPCYFGSALKLNGVEELLKGITFYMEVPSYGAKFGAKVYKISRDEQGNRLTYMKVTGGSLKVKELLTNRKITDKDTENDIEIEKEKNTDKYMEKSVGSSVADEEIWEEKVNQIRIYSGAKFETVNEVQAGCVCAVTGLTHTYPGEGLGEEKESKLPVLEPVLTYRIMLPPDCDVHSMLKNIKLLEEEEPLLHVVWEEKLGEIHAQLMGEVQIEILKRLIWDRFKVRVEFGTGKIVYKETIAAPVEGVGHFEPLRHYAEVHLLLEPGERGSGLTFRTNVSEDVLDRNWQRLILTHLEEKEHKGVLTGAAVTDMQITLINGRAHLKHTEGGDFRQATYRAVRQGLKKAESILLEPVYEYRLEIPSDTVGRALSDLQRMHGTFSAPVQEGDMSVLTGTAPVVRMQDYQAEVISYTKGRGRLSCILKGYEPCHNSEEVIAQIGYDSEQDAENPTGSVFCAHGAGFIVKWDEVENYMHLEASVGREKEEEPEITSAPVRRASRVLELSAEDEKELERMVEASMRKREQARKKYAFGKSREALKQAETAQRSRSFSGQTYAGNGKQKKSAGKTSDGYGMKKENQKEYLLVDGYNIIFAWEELRELAEDNIDGARGRLMDILSNYQGIRKCTVILVFDAYKLKGFPGEVQKYHNIYVVYTKEAETADQYIEKTAHEIGRKYQVTVATSDGTEQVIIRGQGCLLMSAKELKTEICLAREQIRKEHLERQSGEKNYLFHYMDDEMREEMEEVRLGKKNKN